jgi:hypothetical protein
MCILGQGLGFDVGSAICSDLMSARTWGRILCLLGDELGLDVGSDKCSDLMSARILCRLGYGLGLHIGSDKMLRFDVRPDMDSDFGPAQIRLGFDNSSEKCSDLMSAGINART